MLYGMFSFTLSIRLNSEVLRLFMCNNSIIICIPFYRSLHPPPPVPSVQREGEPFRSRLRRIGALAVPTWGLHPGHRYKLDNNVISPQVPIWSHIIALLLGKPMKKLEPEGSFFMFRESSSILSTEYKKLSYFAF